jgi:CRP-like cAMP-binding protein/cation transporter-like permease
MDRKALLASIPAFASLADDDLGALASRLDEARFEPGSTIVKEGAVDSSALFIIEEGEVEISRGYDKGHVALATMGEGQYFGELALIDGSARSATAIAKTTLRVLVLERQDFIDFVHRDPDAAIRVMADLAARLRHTNELVSAATEDMHRMGGMEALDTPYSNAPVWLMIRKRAGWLCALFLGEMLTASAMGHFAGEIERAVVLALFVPLIISSGGNSGSQGTSLIIRALALHDVALRDWLWVLGREIFSGLVLGVLLGAVGFTRIVLWQSFGWTDYGPHYMALAFTIWASLIGVVGFGATAGSMLPFALRRIGFDPATSSAPFVATLVDVTGLIIYFTIASVILRGLVL